MKKPLFYTIILLFFIVSFCQAQQVRSYGTGKLSCSLIKKMIQDSQGFIWIATENGLNKFDGWTFTSYFRDEKDSTSLISNYSETLLNDSKGRLWIGSRKGVQYYSPYKDAFETVHFSDGNTPSVLNLCELHTGEIWAVTAGYGVYSIDPVTMKTTSLEWVNDLCSSLYMHNVYQDHLRRIWIALPGGQVVRIIPQLKKLDFMGMPVESPGKVYTILEDQKKQLWMTTATDVCLWDEQARSFVKMKREEGDVSGFSGMICTQKGELYVNTHNKGLRYVNVAEGKLELVNNKAVPNKDNILSLMQDRSGNLWFGCYKKGIVMFSNESSQFDFLDISSFSSSKNTLSCIYEDNKGNIWVSMGDGVLTCVDKNLRDKTSYALGVNIISMFEDSEGTFWLGSSGSFAQFDKKTGTIRRIPSLQGKTIHCIMEGRNRILYLSAMADGMIRYDLKTNKWDLVSDTTKLNSPMRLGNNWINTILCDSEGLIWLGHCMGINCYDPVRHEFLKLECSSALLANLCYTLLEDNKGHIWMGTHEGLYEYDKRTRKLSCYGIKEGMPSNVICGLGQSKNGDIWCSTYNGLCKLSYPDRTIVNYFSGNGLVDKEYLRGVYSQYTGGAMCVGGMQGITRFIPDSIGQQTVLHEPQLTHVFLNDEEVSAHAILGSKSIASDVWMNARQINLTYKNDIFAFEFSTMEFHERENIKFEYRLVEMGGVWRSTSPGENRITFNYLPPGRYTLEVCACENDQRSSVRSFSIYIAPPWYKTTWSKIGYALVLIGLLLWAFYTWNTRQRRRRQEELNEEKLKFFINIAHELRSPITLIISPLAALIKMEQEETKKKSLQTMQRNANRIVNLINQLLDIRKIDKGQMKIVCCETELIGFIEELFLMFDYQAVKRNIKFSFVHSMENLPVWIDRNNFDKVLMNLIVNAFKYTPDDGEIVMNLTVGEDESASAPLNQYAEISIVDSGVGLDEKKLEKIFDRFYQASSSSYGFGIGLNLTKMLVELHYGSISASNRKDGHGSCFKVRIPLGKGHLKTEELMENADSSNEEPVRLVLKEEIYWEAEGEKIRSVKSKTQWKVLVVDDDEEMREYLKQELGVYYKVITACNGVEAYQAALNQRIDLIISDVVMPEMDGFEFLKMTKGNANISHVPFVLLTTQAEYGNRLKGWNVGADAFLAKPFHIEELLLVCENLIAGRVRLKGRFSVDQEVEDKMKSIEVKANDDFFMERLMNAINDNLENSNFGVEDLAAAVGVSRVQLHRKLKALTGNTTTEFVRNIRLKQAARLLKEKKINVSQIAYLVGFTNPTLFSIAFKKFYGCTPSEYANREVEE